jgi:hypothetical protein
MGGVLGFREECDESGMSKRILLPSNFWDSFLSFFLHTKQLMSGQARERKILLSSSLLATPNRQTE